LEQSATAIARNKATREDQVDVNIQNKHTIDEGGIGTERQQRFTILWL
jgi:hypothetical protein